MLDRGPAASRAAASRAITYSVSPPIDSLNSFQDPSIPPSLAGFLFAELTTLDNHGRLVPELLTRIPTIANGDIRDGGKRILLTLKQHQYWSSGEEITSADIKFSWALVHDPAANYLCVVACRDVTAVQVLDRYRALLLLRSPYGPVIPEGLPPVFPHNWPALGTSPHTAAHRLLEGHNFRYTNASYWTDGPYQVQHFVRSESITFVPTTHYRLHRQPSSTVVVQFPGDGPAKGVPFTADINTGLSIYDTRALASQPEGYRLLLAPSFTLQTILFNDLDATYQGRPNPMLDPRIRRALVLALDRPAVAAGMLESSPRTAKPLVANSLFVQTAGVKERFGTTSAIGSWDPIARRFVQFSTSAQADARILLAQAGYPQGLDIDLTIPLNFPTITPGEITAIQQEWAAVGVRAHIIELHCTPVGPCDTQVPEGDFETVIWDAQVGPDPAAVGPYLVSSAICRVKSTDCGAGYYDPTDLNMAGVRDPGIDTELAQGAATLDPRVRTRAYNRLQRIAAKHAYWAPIMYLPQAVAVRPQVHGVTAQPAGNAAWNAYSWTKGQSSARR